MVKSTIYIYCPAASYTGGPTLAHQLCLYLRNLGKDARMWYDCNVIKRFFIDPVHENYKCYNIPYVQTPPTDSPDISIIALESKVSILLKYKKANKYIWWMSVDNYYLNMSSLWDVLKIRLGKSRPSIEYCKKYESLPRYSIIKDESIIHLVQSEYARLFLSTKDINKDKIYKLGDYLENEILNISDNKNLVRRDNVILYNPKKGFEFTLSLIERMPEFAWIPLINMSKQEIIQQLLSSKLYIDFGNHPGKDRFPREAVMCGCCIITGNRGAAANNIDIPIPQKYKFNEMTDCYDMISDQIRHVLSNYEECITDFEDYKISITGEQKEFESQVKAIFL